MRFLPFTILFIGLVAPALARTPGAPPTPAASSAAGATPKPVRRRMEPAADRITQANGRTLERVQRTMRPAN